MKRGDWGKQWLEVLSLVLPGKDERSVWWPVVDDWERKMCGDEEEMCWSWEMGETMGVVCEREKADGERRWRGGLLRVENQRKGGAKVVLGNERP